MRVVTVSSVRSHQLRSMGMYVPWRNEKSPKRCRIEDLQKGNFVVKGSGCRQFNQVDPDHSQEWLNGTGKRVGVIVSITKTSRVSVEGKIISLWTMCLKYHIHTRKARGDPSDVLLKVCPCFMRLFWLVRIMYPGGMYRLTSVWLHRWPECSWSNTSRTSHQSQDLNCGY